MTRQSPVRGARRRASIVILPGALLAPTAALAHEGGFLHALLGHAPWLLAGLAGLGALTWLARRRWEAGAS